MTYMKSALAAVLAFALAAVSAGGAVAQVPAASGPVKSQHGAWAIVCANEAGAVGEQCALRQDVVAENRPEMVLSIIVLKTADKKARLLRIAAPLGIILPPGVGLYIDGKNLGNAMFTRCLSDFCYSDVVIEDTLFDTLSKGKSAIFTIFQTAEEGIGFDVDLNGFGEGFAALP